MQVSKVCFKLRFFLTKQDVREVQRPYFPRNIREGLDEGAHTDFKRDNDSSYWCGEWRPTDSRWCYH